MRCISCRHGRCCLLGPSWIATSCTSGCSSTTTGLQPSPVSCSRARSLSASTSASSPAWGAFPQSPTRRAFRFAAAALAWVHRLLKEGSRPKVAAMLLRPRLSSAGNADCVRTDAECSQNGLPRKRAKCLAACPQHGKSAGSSRSQDRAQKPSCTQVLGHSKTCFVLLGSWLFLGENITLRQLGGMVLAITGMVGYGVASSKYVAPAHHHAWTLHRLQIHAADRTASCLMPAALSTNNNPSAVTSCPTAITTMRSTLYRSSMHVILHKVRQLASPHPDRRCLCPGRSSVDTCRLDALRLRLCRPSATKPKSVADAEEVPVEAERLLGGDGRASVRSNSASDLRSSLKAIAVA